MARKISMAPGSPHTYVGVVLILLFQRRLTIQLVLDSSITTATKSRSQKYPTITWTYWTPSGRENLILTYPNDDDAIAYLFSLQIAKYGFDWFERLAQQDIQWVRGSATPFILLSQGAESSSSKRVMSFSTTHLDGFNPAIKSKIPSKEKYLSWFQPMAIFRSTKCPESSKLFVSWILSDEWQAPLSKTTTTSINPLNALLGNEIHTNNSTQTQGFRNFENDRAVVEWWKNHYETTLGPAIGPDPNTLY